MLFRRSGPQKCATISWQLQQMGGYVCVCICVCGSAAAASQRTVNGSFLQAELPSSSSCVILPARHSTGAEAKSWPELFPRHSRAVSLRGRSWPRVFLRFRPPSVAFSGVLVALLFGPPIAQNRGIFVNEFRERTKLVNE